MPATSRASPRGRPHVILKLAVSADGMIGRREGERMMITSPPALTAVQAMRAEADAVVIGIGTVLVDDPRLTVRLPGLEKRSPLRVVLDATARLPLALEAGGDGARGAGRRRDRARGAGRAQGRARARPGVRIIEVGDGSGGVEPRGGAEALAERASRASSSKAGRGSRPRWSPRDVVDEVILFRAPVVVGADGVRALDGYALSAIERSPRYRQIEAAIVGDDQMRRYLRA